MIEAAGKPEPNLLLKAARGDVAAARELLDKTGPVVYGFVFARVGGDEASAEDVVQATFLEAVRSATSFRGDSALSTWLCAIARRQLARHYERERKQRRTRSRLQLVVGVEESPPPDEAVADRDVVIQALGALSPLHRQVLVLKYLDGLSVSEIASEVGRTEIQVQSLLQRARGGLRSQLNEARHD